MASVKIKVNHKTVNRDSGKATIVLFITHQRKFFMLSLMCSHVEPGHLICYENGAAEISPKAKYYENRIFYLTRKPDLDK